MNNLLKLFQILTSGFKEVDFLRISSCQYSARNLPPPPPMVAMFFDGSKFNEQVLKTVTQESCEIILKYDNRFQRRRILKNFSDVHTVKKVPPPSPAAKFLDGSKFREQF